MRWGEGIVLSGGKPSEIKGRNWGEGRKKARGRRITKKTFTEKWEKRKVQRKFAQSVVGKKGGKAEHLWIDSNASNSISWNRGVE